MKKVKGFCSVCNNFRAFQVTDVRLAIRSAHIVGSLKNVQVAGQTHYTGVCSKGHETPFAPTIKPMARIYRREVKDKTLQGRRDAWAMATYMVHRDSFRDPEREAHYAPGHECDEDCPEFYYPDYVW